MTESAFRSAVEEILGAPRGSLQDTDTRDTVENWSSIADVQLFTLITSEFGIEPDEEILGAESIGDLTHVLSERRVFEA
jgi:acyl carrier protein